MSSSIGRGDKGDSAKYFLKKEVPKPHCHTPQYLQHQVDPLISVCRRKIQLIDRAFEWKLNRQILDIDRGLLRAQSGCSAVIRQLPVTDKAITLSESVMWIGHSCWKDELIVADFRLTSTN
jgi:hypothetical protein